MLFKLCSNLIFRGLFLISLSTCYLRSGKGRMELLSRAGKEKGRFGLINNVIGAIEEGGQEGLGTGSWCLSLIGDSLTGAQRCLELFKRTSAWQALSLNLPSEIQGLISNAPESRPSCSTFCLTSSSLCQWDTVIPTKMTENIEASCLRQ